MDHSITISNGPMQIEDSKEKRTEIVKKKTNLTNLVIKLMICFSSLSNQTFYSLEPTKF